MKTEWMRKRCNSNLTRINCWVCVFFYLLTSGDKTECAAHVHCTNIKHLKRKVIMFLFNHNESVRMKLRKIAEFLIALLGKLHAALQHTHVDRCMARPPSSCGTFSDTNTHKHKEGEREIVHSLRWRKKNQPILKNKFMQRLHIFQHFIIPYNNIYCWLFHGWGCRLYD